MHLQPVPSKVEEVLRRMPPCVPPLTRHHVAPCRCFRIVRVWCVSYKRLPRDPAEFAHTWVVVHLTPSNTSCMLPPRAHILESLPLLPWTALLTIFYVTPMKPQRRKQPRSRCLNTWKVRLEPFPIPFPVLKLLYKDLQYWLLTLEILKNLVNACGTLFGWMCLFKILMFWGVFFNAKYEKKIPK